MIDGVPLATKLPKNARRTQRDAQWNHVASLKLISVERGRAMADLRLAHVAGGPVFGLSLTLRASALMSGKRASDKWVSPSFR